MCQSPFEVVVTAASSIVLYELLKHIYEDQRRVCEQPLQESEGAPLLAAIPRRSAPLRAVPAEAKTETIVKDEDVQVKLENAPVKLEQIQAKISDVLAGGQGRSKLSTHNTSNSTSRFQSHLRVFRHHPYARPEARSHAAGGTALVNEAAPANSGTTRGKRYRKQRKMAERWRAEQEALKLERVKTQRAGPSS